MVSIWCVSSLHPLVPSEQSVFDSAMAGSWVSCDPGFGEEQTITFKRSGGKSYEVTSADKRGEIKFKAQLGKLDESWYLDLAPQGHTPSQPQMIPTHVFVRVELSEQELRLG